MGGPGTPQASAEPSLPSVRVAQGPAFRAGILRRCSRAPRARGRDETRDCKGWKGREPRSDGPRARLTPRGSVRACYEGPPDSAVSGRTHRILTKDDQPPLSSSWLSVEEDNIAISAD